MQEWKNSLNYNYQKMSSKASCRTQERVLKSLISTLNTATKSQKNAGCYYRSPGNTGHIILPCTNHRVSVPRIECAVWLPHGKGKIETVSKENWKEQRIGTLVKAGLLKTQTDISTRVFNMKQSDPMAGISTPNLKSYKTEVKKQCFHCVIFAV